MSRRAQAAAGRVRPAAESSDSSMSDYEFTITLCVRHPDIDPARITATLGIDPQASWKKGDPRVGPQGESLTGAHRESYWTGGLMAAPQLSSEYSSIEVELLKILARLREYYEFLLELRSDGAASELHVSLFARQEFRLDFQPSTLELLGRLGLAVALEVHPHVPEPRPRPSSN
jgi:Domain of unknown function (DUF4279)